MRIGFLSYINALPVTWGLESGTVGRGTEVIVAEPSRLNALTQQGALDVTPVSSIQWLHCREQYRPVPGVALSSRGPVQSVMLFSRVPVSALCGRNVAITGATATSLILLQILVPGIRPVPVQPLSDDVPAVLLIGDQALLDAPDVPYRLDLGAAWLERTGLPMVFALWLMRRDGPEEEKAARLLEASQDWGRQNRVAVLAEAARRTGLSPERLSDYYRCLYYAVGEAERQGLFEYYKQAHRLGLAPPPTPEMREQFALSMEETKR